MTWGFVQSWGGQGVGVTTLAETSTSSMTSGTKMLAFIATDQAGTANFSAATVKDGSGNSFTSLFTVAQGGSNGAISMWVLDTPAGDAGSVCTVTIAGLSTACAITMIVEEWSGLRAGSTSAILDGTGGTLGLSTTGNVGPPSYASTASNELLLYVFGDDGFGATVTLPSGYTADAKNELGSTNSNIAVAYKNSTGGTETGTWNVASSDDWAMLMVAVKLPGAAATPPPLPLGRTTGGKPGRKGASQGSGRPLVRPAAPAEVVQALGAAVRGKPGRKGRSQGSPLPLVTPVVPSTQPPPATGRTITGRKARKGTSAGSPQPLAHIEDVPPVPSGTAVRGKPGRRGSSAGSKPIPVGFTPIPNEPAATGRTVRGSTGRKGSAAGSRAPLPSPLRIAATAIGKTITGRRGRRGTVQGSPRPLVAAFVTPQQGTVTTTAVPAATVTISSTLAGTVAITGTAAGTVTIVSTGAGTVSISNQLAGTVTIVNEL